MSEHAVGKRHPLLMYRRTLDRLWPSLVLLGAICLVLWAWSFWGKTELIPPAEAPWLFFAGALLTLLGVVFILLRFAAYVQAHRDHLRLVTPFLQTRISYRRIRAVHPVDMNSLFPPNRISWVKRGYLEPFYGRTAVVVELHGYPLPLAVLRLFLGWAMFYRQGEGFILLVPDWMAFSTELDTLRTRWLEMQKRRQSAY
ncbi:MAG: hypothetical protein ACOY16_13995 [Chloroflexota bacterium]